MLKFGRPKTTFIFRVTQKPFDLGGGFWVRATRTALREPIKQIRPITKRTNVRQSLSKSKRFMRTAGAVVVAAALAACGAQGAPPEPHDAVHSQAGAASPLALRPLSADEATKTILTEADTMPRGLQMQNYVQVKESFTLTAQDALAGKHESKDCATTRLALHEVEAFPDIGKEVTHAGINTISAPTADSQRLEYYLQTRVFESAADARAYLETVGKAIPACPVFTDTSGTTADTFTLSNIETAPTQVKAQVSNSNKASSSYGPIVSIGFYQANNLVFQIKAMSSDAYTNQLAQLSIDKILAVSKNP